MKLVICEGVVVQCAAFQRPIREGDKKKPRESVARSDSIAYPLPFNKHVWEKYLLELFKPALLFFLQKQKQKQAKWVTTRAL